MITAITAILGALTGLVPGILQFFNQRATNAHQLEIRKLELQAAREGTALQVDLAHAQSDIQQQSRIYDFGNKPTGIGWVDSVTVLVRPWITIVVFHMWLAVEVALLIYGIKSGYDFDKLMKLLWDEASQAMLAAIVGFWFGNRMLVRGEQMAATMAVANPPPVVVARPARAAAAAAPAPAAPPAARRPPEAPRSGIIPPPPGDRS